jgi:hypothetical protein
LLAIQREGYPWGGDSKDFVGEAATLLAGMPAGDRSALAIYRGLLASETRRAGKRIPCEQTPRNVFFLPDIMRLEPGVRVVNMVRDPRDVLLSQRQRWRRRQLGAHRMPWYEGLRSRINYHPITITRLWSSAVDAGDAVAGDARVVTVRFEDLTTHPEGEVRRVCETLGLEFTADLLAVPRIGSSREADEPDRTGIRESASGGWAREGLSSEEVFLCERVAAKQMGRHRFDASGKRPRVFPLAWQLLRFPLHLAGVVLVNFTRVRNPVAAFRRRLLRKGPPQVERA